MITIESRNCDDMRLTHTFESPAALLKDLTSDDPSMGDNEILLVSQTGVGVLYSSLGRKADSYEDTVRTADLVEWFS